MSVMLPQTDDIDAKDKYCSQLEYASVVYGLHADIASDINTIPFINAPAVGMSVASHAAKGSIDITMLQNGCADIPFEEVKQLITKHFHELSRQHNEQHVVLDKVYDLSAMALMTIEKMRAEMNQGFSQVVEFVRHTTIEKVVTKINKFVEYFNEEKESIEELAADDYIRKLEQEDLFQYLKDTKTPKDDNLRSPLFEIIENGYAIPTNKDDEIAYQALYSLFYGVQTCEAVMLFLIKTQSYLADYYYKKGNLDRYNAHFTNLISVFQDFRRFLVGSENNPKLSLLQKVKSVLDAVEKRKLESEYDLESEVIKNFSSMMTRVKNLQLFSILDTPGNNIRIQFKERGIKTPFRKWKPGVRVSYAIQYKSEGKYSRISEWTNPVEVEDKAHPFLTLPKSSNSYSRIIFRRFNNDTPQMISVVSSSKIEIKDISRDMYDTAGDVNEGKALEDFDILRQHGASMEGSYEMGRTSLHNAVIQGNTRIMNRIFTTSMNANVFVNNKDKEGFTPLHLATIKGEIDTVVKLLEEGADLNSASAKEKMAPLHIAAREGLPNIINKFFTFPCHSIRCRVYCFIQDYNLFTPMHYAVQGGLEAIKALVGNKCDYNAKSHKGLTPLHLSIMKNDKHITNFLLKQKGIQVNCMDEENRTPLHYASMLGHADAVQSLINCNEVKVNVKSKIEEWTPLHFAVSFKRNAIVDKLLTAKHIAVDEPDKNGVTPFLLSAQKRDKDSTSKLLIKGAKINQKTKNGLTALHMATLRNDPDMVSFLLDKGADVKLGTNDNETSLHLAASAGFTDIVKLLIGKGADIKARNKINRNPLDLAVSNGKLNVVRILSGKGVGITEFEKKGPDSYYIAIRNGYLDIVQFLITSGKINTSKKNIRDTKIKYGAQTILEASACDAVRYGQLNMVKYFIGDLKSNGCFSLIHAVISNKLDIVKYFVEDKTIAVKKSEFIILNLAIENNNEDIVNYLLSKGVNINEHFYGITPLSEAVQKAGVEMVKFLVNNNADVSFKNEKGETLLFLAYKNAHIVKYLVEEKYLNVNARNNEGNTVLHVAAANSDVAKLTIEILCDLGADITVKNKKKETPYDIAKKSGKEINECLKPVSVKRSMNIVSDSSKFSGGEIKGIQRDKSFLLKEVPKTTNILNLPPQKFTSLKEKYITGNSNSLVNPKGPKNLESLLLLDFFIRKMTGRKHVFFRENFIPELEAKTMALEIVEEYLKHLNDTTPVADYVDLSEIHQNVFKLIKNGNFSKIPEVLKVRS